VAAPQHRADLFLAPASDPREGGRTSGDERATLTESLRGQRLTLQIKCDGLDAGQLARRAVEPSTLSLLRLVRHMAEVERGWFRRRFAGLQVPKRYQTQADPDADFNGAAADPAVVEEAWAAWREEVAFAEQFTADHDLGLAGRDSDGQPVSPRELLVHTIEEYARHNGHADLLRERIDGRIGQWHSRTLAKKPGQSQLTVRDSSSRSRACSAVMRRCRHGVMTTRARPDQGILRGRGSGPEDWPSDSCHTRSTQAGEAATPGPAWK
jgi:uncharacterized damage-inducible protein DinB